MIRLGVRYLECRDTQKKYKVYLHSPLRWFSVQSGYSNLNFSVDV